MHGHIVGDLLLVDAANRIESCIRDMDTVGRFSGDEFVVMLGGLGADKIISTLQATAVAEKICAALSEPYIFTINHDEQPATIVKHHCTASIGVVVFNGSIENQADILKWADLAMYEAKDADRNQVRFYSEKV